MTPEEKQQLDQVIKRHNQQPPSTSTITCWNDVDFLLSLVKEQEAGSEFARTVAATIAADLGYQGGIRNQQALAATIESALNNFATSMRSRCIEKAAEMEQRYREDAVLASNGNDNINMLILLHKATAAIEIKRALESVTIQEQENV